MVPNPAHFTYTKYIYYGNVFRRKEINGVPLLFRETFQNHPAVNTEKSALVKNVTRYSRPMKTVVLPDLCELCVYSNTNLTVCYHEGERITL